MFLQTLSLISLLAVLIYAFKSPQPRKVVSYPLKVSKEESDEHLAYIRGRIENLKVVAKNDEIARNATMKALKKLSKSIQELIQD